MTNHNPVSTSFKPGQSGNPGGRPKKDWTWSGLLEQVANEIEPKSRKPFKELVTRRLWVEAANGNLGAQKEIMNRMEGLPQARTDLTTQGEKLSSILYLPHERTEPKRDNTTTKTTGSAGDK
jgi:hypothetical protein